MRRVNRGAECITKRKDTSVGHNSLVPFPPIVVWLRTLVLAPAMSVPSRERTVVRVSYPFSLVPRTNPSFQRVSHVFAEDFYAELNRVQRNERVILRFINLAIRYISTRIVETRNLHELKEFLDRFQACLEAPWMWDELRRLVSWARRRWPVCYDFHCLRVCLSKSLTRPSPQNETWRTMLQIHS